MKIQSSQFVITGANRGIGQAVAKMAAVSGAHLHLVARSWSEGVRSSLTQLGAASVELYQADLATKEGAAQLAQQLSSVEVDVLFNNAGLLTGGLLEQQSLDEIYAMFQVNLNALVHLTHALLPGMIQRKKGKIINNSSVSAFMHFPCASTYAASKAAVVAFTDCLEAELAGTGVSTLCLVTPGIKTRMFDEIEVKYAKNFEIPKDSISAEDYAEKIRVAIEGDWKYYWPKGTTALGLWTARYLNPVFRSAVQKRFRR
ncbi:MAG: SDR family NAD(P)-dependent oxidoreductase [Bdellovibrionales bacterium]|nr:SDR family NAD(P)-dependent oxidoreductase [Bdellovibrionales bacterium]